MQHFFLIIICLADVVDGETVEVGLYFLINRFLLPPPAASL